MHHGPNCGGPAVDPPYFDALSETTANLVRIRELEAAAELRRQRQAALENQIMRTGLARGDREELLQRQAETAPRMERLTSTPQRQMLPPAPSAAERDLLHPQDRIQRVLQPRTPKHPRSSR